MAKLLSYFNPKSVTWWAGVGLIMMGIARLRFDYAALAEFSQVVAVFIGTGDASPAALIVAGLGFIGFRAKLERGPE